MWSGFGRILKFALELFVLVSILRYRLYHRVKHLFNFRFFVEHPLVLKLAFSGRNSWLAIGLLLLLLGRVRKRAILASLTVHGRCSLEVSSVVDKTFASSSVGLRNLDDRVLCTCTSPNSLPAIGLWRVVNLTVCVDAYRLLRTRQGTQHWRA